LRSLNHAGLMASTGLMGPQPYHIPKNFIIDRNLKDQE
jgi:hypothetical protein